MKRYVSIFKEQSLKEVESSDYVVRHDTYSSAIQEALRIAYDKGYYIKEDEIFSNVTTRPKPGEGKTNKITLLLEKFNKEESMTWEEANAKSMKRKDTRLPTVDELQAIHGSDQKVLYGFQSGLYACVDFKKGNTVNMLNGKYEKVPNDTMVKVKILKETGKGLQIQVYNMGNDIKNNFELNCYIN